ncbi:AI-2E family transporter [Pseudactinotalea terrae]|uniref:AI-2E family transporter n=1 Tax=Pseudactinotalea terrae TaxID=1743262 RepID=UPI0012E20728|nr:AI-2E family transporter [Pseudactinotalea terrae]
MKMPSILRRASRATPSTTAIPQPDQDRSAAHRPVMIRSSRGSTPRVRRLPEGHMRLEESGDGAPRWMRKAAGISWRLLVILAVVVVLVYATARIQLVFVAVFLALVFSSVLRPLVNLLSRWIPRGLAVVASLLAAILVMGGIVTFVVQSVRGQWQNLSEEFTAGMQDLLGQLEHLPFGMSVSADQLREWFQQGEQWIQENQDTLINRAATGAAEGAGSLFEVFAILALATFCTVFFLARGSQMWEWFINQLPARVREKWVMGGEIAWYTFSGFARGTVLVALADGALAAIILSVLQVPLAAPLAVLVFIGAFIPLIGAPAAMVVAMIVALATQGPLIAVVVGIGIALIGQFEGHVLTPLIMGKQVRLHPVAVALSVTSGTLVAGVLGAVIVVPIVAVIWAVYAKLRNIDPPMTTDEMSAIKQKVITAREHLTSKG